MKCYVYISVDVYIATFICIIPALGNKFECSQYSQKYKLGYNMVMVDFFYPEHKTLQQFPPQNWPCKYILWVCLILL